MNFTNLPQEPEKRRIILVLSDIGLQQLKQKSQKDISVGELFLNPQVSLLNASTTESSPLVEKLRNSGLLNPGSLLIQSPYEVSNYADAVEASYTFAQEKCFYFATLCGLLAAQKVSVEYMEMQTANDQTKFYAKVNSPYGGGGIGAEKRAWEKMRKTISLEQEYGEAEPNLDAARTYIKKHQLLCDPHMSGLLDLREAKVPVKKEKFNLSITKDSQKNLNVAFSLNVPTQVVELNVDIKQIKTETFNFSVQIEVEF